MLEDFTIRNFRGIKELTLPSLKRVNLLVGKNGVGKTSVLEAVQLWASGFDAAVAREFLVRRNEDVLVLNNLELLTMLSSAGTNLADFVLGPKGNRRQAWSIPWPEPGIPQVYLGTSPPLDRGPAHRIPLEREPPRERRRLPLPQLFIPSTMLGNSLFSELWGEVELTGKDDRVVEILKMLAPELERITTRKFSDRVGLAPIAKVRGTDGPVPLARLGEGVSRLASLALALVVTEGGTVLIDEFENGLHYSIQKQAWEFVLKLAEELDVQVFATTHSNDTVHALAEASKANDHIVYRIQRRRGELHAVSFDSDDLEFAVTEELEVR